MKDGKKLTKAQLRKLESEKKQYLKIAKELCYDEDILLAIKNAKSSNEIQKVMTNGRLRS